MRPLFHPSIEDITVEGILHALSDPVRVQIFAAIARTPDNTHTCSAFLEVSERSVPKSTLSQHFKALREAGLIRSERRGVEMHNTARCEEVNVRFPGLLPAIINAHKVQSERDKRALRKKRVSGG
jgi:DNA-binding transcriptional ArsR family regulator